MIRGLAQVLIAVSTRAGRTARELQLAFDLFKALTVLSADSSLLFLQRLDAVTQRICDLKALVLRIVAVASASPFQRTLQLLDGFNQAVRLLNLLIFFPVTKSVLRRLKMLVCPTYAFTSFSWLFSVADSAEKSCRLGQHAKK